ncbi:MAG: response regulator, partial [Deltaproteobacteria bacterium]|nr:response regulator [Deltaproteobacteria bacterium]
MDKVLARVREAFSGEARDRLNQAAAALARLETDASDVEARRALRRHVHRIGVQAGALRLDRVAAAAREADDALAAALLLGRVPDRASVDRVAAAIRDAAAPAANGVDLSGLAVLVAPAGVRSRPSADRVDLSRCEVVASAAELEAVLARRPVPVVVLDSTAPLATLTAAAQAARAWRSASDSSPPVIAIGPDRGIVDRHVLTQAGVATSLPADAQPADVARAVVKLMRDREGSRGIAFHLGNDPDIRNALEKELAADDVRVWSFPDMNAMLRRWVERSPDLVVVSFTRGHGAALRAVTDLRADPEAGRLPIVVVTDRTDPDTRRAAIDAGADDWIAFPWTSAELFSRVVAPIDFRRLAIRRASAPAPSSLQLAAEPVPEPEPVPVPVPVPVPEP